MTIPVHDPLLTHEAFDRVYVASQNWDNMILDHPFIVGSAGLMDFAKSISLLMGEMYQVIGRIEGYVD